MGPCTKFLSVIGSTDVTYNKVSILQWNANGIFARLTELRNYLSKQPSSPHIICLQEIKVRANKTLILDGYTIELKHRSGYNPAIGRARYGGLAIAVQTGLSYSILNTNPDTETLAIQVKISNISHSIINTYMPPSMSPAQDSEHLLHLATLCAINRHLVITGDFNAYSPAWGASHLDKRGAEIESFIDNEELTVLNDGRGTHLTNTGHVTPIDLSLCSPNISLTSSWDILPSTLGSDHYPINIVLNNSFTTLETHHVEKFQLKKADWERFHQEATANFIHVDVKRSDVTDESLYNSIKCAIINAAEQSIPKSRPPKKRLKNVRFWNEKCDQAIEKRSQAETRAKQSHTLESCIEYRQAKAQCQKTIRQQKTESWTEYCDSLTETSRLTSVWKMSRSMSGLNSSSTMPTFKVNGQVYETDTQKADLFVEKYSNISKLTNHTLEFQKSSANMKKTWIGETAHAKCTPHVLDDQIELHELSAAISQAKRGSAPGQDLISYELIKNLPKSAVSKLLVLYNRL